MQDKDLTRAMGKLEELRHCDSCPFPVYLCRTISKDLFGKERCLLIIVLREILTFHTEEAKKPRKEFKDKASK